MERDEIDAARVLLLTPPPELSELGSFWRAAAAAHLTTRLDTYLRGGIPRTVARRAFSGEAVALELLKGAARDLRAAAAVLEANAERFRSLTLGMDANRTYHAAKAAEAAADALDPTS